jgi:hypothetical protein
MNPTEAVLIDPHKITHRHIRTYSECANKLRLIMRSIPYSNSVIVAGIVNLNANHYVPYFLYKNAKNRICVFTIDPSHETSPLLERCFNDIFPGCMYVDAYIAQQERQRDCGFNSLESIHNVAKSLLSENPVLSVVDDKLHFDPRGLTVNGNPYKAFDYVREEPFFLQPFMEQGQKNRARWAELFKTKNQVDYGNGGIVEYSYEKNVEEQNRNDDLGGIYSFIAGIMIAEGTLNQYEEQYIHRLELPTPQQLEAIRHHILQGFTQQQLKVSPEVLENHAGKDSIYTIFKINFKEKTPIALLNVFKNIYLPHCKIERNTTAETILINFTNTDKYLEFSKLLLADQLKELHQKALEYAKERVKIKTLQLKEEYIHSYIIHHIETFLKNNEAKLDNIIPAIIHELQKNEATRNEVTLLLTYKETTTKLYDTITNAINVCIQSKVDLYWDLLKKQPQLLQNEVLIDQWNEAINIYELERFLQPEQERLERFLQPEQERLERFLQPEQEKKEEKALDGHPAAREITANKNAIYYVLIQKSLKEKHHHTYLKKMEEQLAVFVKGILCHPNNLEYAMNLTSREQIHISNQDEHLDLFFKMVKNSEMKISFDPSQKTLYAEILKKQIQIEVPTHFREMSMNRYKDRYCQLISKATLSDLKEEKTSSVSNHNQLQSLCIKNKFPILPGEKIEDFLELYQPQFHKDRRKCINEVDLIHRQEKDTVEILRICKENKLLSPARLSHYKKTYLKNEHLYQLPLSQLIQSAPDLIQKNSTFLFAIATELYTNPHYEKSAQKPKLYTRHTRDLLCRLFNIDQYKPQTSIDDQISHKLQILREPLYLHDVLLDMPNTKTFYQALLEEAKSICRPEQLDGVMAFIESISALDPISEKFFNVNSPLVKINMLFKKCVSNARQANQLEELFGKISTKTKPIYEMIDDLFQWSKQIILPQQNDLVLLP